MEIGQIVVVMKLTPLRDACDGFLHGSLGGQVTRVAAEQGEVGTAFKGRKAPGVPFDLPCHIARSNSGGRNGWQQVSSTVGELRTPFS